MALQAAEDAGDWIGRHRHLVPDPDFDGLPGVGDEVGNGLPPMSISSMSRIAWLSSPLLGRAAGGGMMGRGRGPCKRQPARRPARWTANCRRIRTLGPNGVTLILQSYFVGPAARRRRFRHRAPIPHSDRQLSVVSWPATRNIRYSNYLPEAPGMPPRGFCFCAMTRCLPAETVHLQTRSWTQAGEWSGVTVSGGSCGGSPSGGCRHRVV
jgi:hypothetical protein